MTEGNSHTEGAVTFFAKCEDALAIACGYLATDVT